MIKRFLNYTEIRTKITSTLTFLFALLYLIYQKQSIQWENTILFFLGMFFFDLTTTAINNYIDTKDNGQQLDFTRKQSKHIIYALFLVSTIFGLILAFRTDLVVLLVGALCFFAGILYTFGPIPISRMPLGEIVSGFFYGIIIPFILFYINFPPGTYLSYNLGFDTISINFQVIPIIELLIFSVIPFSVTANIMLSNNICDLEKDVLVNRFTLPYYIGKLSLPFFAILYYSTYVALILMVIIKMLSPIVLFALLTIIPVQKNISAFMKKQDKSTTFHLSILNFIWIMLGFSIMLFLSIVITYA